MVKLLPLLLLSTTAWAGDTLLGTIVASPSQNNLALFSNSSGESFILRQGSRFKDWLVSKIDPKVVTLSRGNTLLTLYAGDKVDEGDKVNITHGIERTGNSLAISQALRDYVIKDKLATVLMQAGAVPAYRSGEIIGYTLFEIDKGSIYDLVGLRDGDTVTHIDGKPLVSPWAAIQLLKSVSGADKFEFTLLRNGQEQTVAVAVR